MLVKTDEMAAWAAQGRSIIEGEIIKGEERLQQLRAALELLPTIIAAATGEQVEEHGGKRVPDIALIRGKAAGLAATRSAARIGRAPRSSSKGGGITARIAEAIGAGASTMTELRANMPRANVHSVATAVHRLAKQGIVLISGEGKDKRLRLSANGRRQQNGVAHHEPAASEEEPNLTETIVAALAGGPASMPVVKERVMAKRPSTSPPSIYATMGRLVAQGRVLATGEHPMKTYSAL